VLDVVQQNCRRRVGRGGQEDRCSGDLDRSMLGLSFDYGHELVQRDVLVFSRSTLTPFRQVHIIVIKVPAMRMGT